MESENYSRTAITIIRGGFTYTILRPDRTVHAVVRDQTCRKLTRGQMEGEADLHLAQVQERADKLQRRAQAWPSLATA